MTGFWHPGIQMSAMNEIAAKEQIRERYKPSVTPELSQSISDIYKRAQFLPGTVVLPLAKANASVDATDALNQAASKIALAPETKDPEGWWQRNVYGSIKKASQYTFAALNLAPDVAQNVAAKVLNSDEANPTMDGWFKSTSLGSLIANDEGAGEGFFLGGEAAAEQSERARKFRGTIDDDGKKAFTVGRFAAGLVLPDNSTAYNVISGLVDGAVAVGADPTLFAGKAIKAARTTANIIPDTGRALAEVEVLRAAGKAKEAELIQKSIDEAVGVTKDIRSLRRKASNTAQRVKRDQELVEIYKVRQATLQERAGQLVAEGKTWEASQIYDVLKGNNTIPQLEARIARNVELGKSYSDKAQERFLEKMNAPSRKELLEQAGNISQQNQVWDKTQFNKWWSNNRGARRIEKSIQSIVDEFTAGKVGKDAQTIQNLRHALAHKIVSKEFGGTITQADALRFIDGGEGNGVKYVIAEAANRLKSAESGMTGVFPTDIRELPGAKALNSFKDATIYRVPKVEKYVKTVFGKAASAKMLVKGDPTSRFKAVENVKRLLDSVGNKIDPETYNRVLGQAAYAYGETGGINAIYDTRGVIKDAVRAVLEQGMDMPKQAVDNVLKQYDEQFAKLQTRIATEIGTNPGHKYIRSLIDGNLLDISEEDLIKQLAGQNSMITSIDDLDAKIFSPTISSELLQNVQFLPDPRQLRRLTQNPFFQRTLSKATGGKVRVGKLLSTKEGDPRGLIELAEIAQNDLWKPLTLMNPGYLLRNLMDGQFHIAMSSDKSLAGFFNSPSVWFQWVMNKRGVGDIRGLDFEDQEAFLDAIQRGSARYVGDPTNAAERVYTNGDYVKVTRQGNEQAHTLGILDQLRMFNKAPEVRAAIANFSADGVLDVDKMMEFLRKNPTLRDELVNTARQGYRYGTENGRSVKIKVPMPTNGDEDLLLRNFIRTELGGRAEKFQAPELKVMAQHNRVPLIDEGMDRADIVDYLPTDKIDGQTLEQRIVSFEGKPGAGTIIAGPVNEPYDLVVVGTRKTQRVIRIDGTKAEREVWDTMKIKKLGDADEGRAWESTRNGYNRKGQAAQGSPYDEDAVKVINRVYGSAENVDNSLIPKETGYAVRATDGGKEGFERVMSKWKDVSNGFFETLVGSSMAKLEKSPLYRQYYYKYALDNADLLSADEFEGLITGIRSGAKRMGVSENAYVGGSGRDKQFDALLARAKDATGVGTVAQLDKFAQVQSLNSMKSLLYDAAERTNLEDTMRVLMPFGAAWREVISKYIKQVAADPTNIRKVERTFTGLTNVDLEQDGTGFFYKDPQSGQYMFNYPGSDKASRLFTGLTAPIAAPVKGLSLGLSYMPALGPIGQITADKILPFVPKESDMRRTFLPYGTPGTKFSDFAPGWARKTIDAWQADPDKANSQFAQTYVETVRAMYATGEYDTSIPAEREKLLEDAKGKARVLSLFRAANQFIGPAAGAARFEIDSKQGDVYMAHLVKQFQELQSANYDDAVPKFLEMFGEDMMLYVSGKSRSEIGGIEPTETFNQWALDNKNLMDRFEGVAGFMAPGQSEFSFAVWKKQIDRGERTRLSAREVIDQAELMVGSAKFRAARLRFGAYPTSEQRTWLRAYRSALHKELPGFPEVASFDPAKFPTFVGELRQLVDTPEMANNDVATATKIYLEKRDQVLASAGQVGLLTIKSRRTAPLRDYLASIGEALIQKYPDFKRIYEQKLQAELMQYEEQ